MKMGAKALVMVQGYAAVALEETVSKNQALDTLADIARANLGESASDFAVLQWIEQRIAPVAAARNDKPPRIMARFNRSIEAAAKYYGPVTAEVARLRIVGNKEAADAAKK